MNIIQLEQKVIELTKEVGSWIKNERINYNPLHTEVKALNDLVSYVDKTSEQKLVEGLKNILPEAGFIVEEQTETETRDYNWIVDPLDGTTNFIHGINCYAISIALELKGEVLIGVVFEITQNECFHASKGNGAYLNGKPINVSDTDQLQNSLIATGFPINNFSKVKAYLQTLEVFMRQTRGIRRIGAAAADLCFLACGRVDGFFEFNLKPWDVAAGALIVKEAGGIVTDFSLKDNWLFGKEVIASNTKLNADFSEIVSSHFRK
ncbi:MAG: inositol monophosphatase [Bacteroidetes bacterium]|nr:inositol monophosphatase [Bacteroidota bacterium]MCA6444016.1 inositol monophosphatase [Bacteroidota bacterium]